MSNQWILWKPVIEISNGIISPASQRANSIKECKNESSIKLHSCLSIKIVVFFCIYVSVKLDRVWRYYMVCHAHAANIKVDMIAIEHTFSNNRRHCHILHTQLMRSQFRTPIHLTRQSYRFCYQYKWMDDYNTKTHEFRLYSAVIYSFVCVWLFLGTCCYRYTCYCSKFFFVFFSILVFA